MNNPNFYLYLLVMAGVTYLVRMLPLVLVKKKIENRFLVSFLYYIPYAVLSAMTLPACFYATGNMISALCGVAFALFLALRGKKLLPVALGATAAVFVAEVIIRFL